jgi:phenol hydroxylase P4 protein
MSVKSTKEYVGVSRDTVDGFGGKQITYVSWDHHLLFAAPFLICTPSDTPFREFVEGPLSALIEPDPDAAQVDWQAVEWLKGNEPWVPDFDKTLVENGIQHSLVPLS